MHVAHSSVPVEAAVAATSSQRQLHIDALKLLASQLIVLHHLIAYGPISDAVNVLAPAAFDWLFEHTRMAVHIFLVLGGYLAARGFSPQGGAWNGSPLHAMLQRYRRLVLPCLAALVLAVVSAALTRLWMVDDFVPARPTLTQTLAHVLLIQGVLGLESLTAGIWYVAIDFQLFVMMALLLWTGHKLSQSSKRADLIGSAVAQTLVLAMMLSSLFFFNRDDHWDNWALYFFGSYGMGAVAYWVGCSRRPAGYLSLLAVCGLAALMLDYRPRVWLALVVSLLLGLAQWQGSRFQLPRLPARLVKFVTTMGKLSYALFLVHFPVLMLGNALFVHLGLSGPVSGIALLLACWAVSLGVAVLFERWVEAPLARKPRAPAVLQPG